MRKNDLTQEWVTLAQLLELRPGDAVLDAQSDGDALLLILATEVTERGICVGMTFGQQALQKVTQQKEDYDLREVEVVAAHPIKTPFRDNRFNGVVIRHTLGFPAVEPIMNEAWRITRSGGKVIVRHTEWNIKLPKATPEDEEMLATLHPACCTNGRDFFKRLEHFSDVHQWRDSRMDVFTIASRDVRAPRRYAYDWRTMLKDQLTRTRRFETRPILDLITKLEETRGAKVSAERYLFLGVKS